MALAGALCTSLLAVTGITNRSLRALVAGLLGVDYTTGQMSYDLRRLRMKGVITRLPGTNSYALTPTACASSCSTPSCTTGFSSHSPRRTSHQHRCVYVKPCTPSTRTSTTT